jgi:hypothetical protein
MNTKDIVDGHGHGYHNIQEENKDYQILEEVALK